MGKRRMDSDLHRIKLDKGTVYQTSRGGTTISVIRLEVNANV